MKILRHKWKEIKGKFRTHQCEKCGCIRYWSDSLGILMYQWGDNIGYKAPECKLMNSTLYNPIIY